MKSHAHVCLRVFGRRLRFSMLCLLSIGAEVQAGVPSERVCLNLRQEAVAMPEVATEGLKRIRIKVGEFIFDALSAGPEAGEPVLLLHGFPQTSHSYRHQLKALGAAGYHAVAPDQRGYSPGARPAKTEDYAMSLLIGDVVGMADTLGFGRFHLVGHDWGAAVAWNLAAAHPKRLLTLNTISVPHPQAFADVLNDPDSSQARMSGYMEFFRAAGTEDVLTSNGASGLRQMYAGIPKEAIDEYVRVLGTPAALGAALNWYRANAFTKERKLNPITTPTLFVWSDADTALGRDGAEVCGKYVGGPYRYEVIPGVSHWVPDLAPTQLNRFLLEHLAKYSAR